MDTMHLPCATGAMGAVGAVGGIRVELLQRQCLPTGPHGASPCRVCVPRRGAGLGRHPPPRPLMASPPVSAATLKSKQDELHRKALQTLER